MSDFRIENKYLVSSNKINQIYEFLKISNSETLFKNRIINSIYFDNPDFQSFIDSEEGTVPRKKIRFRFYSNYQEINNLDSFFEIKINSYEGKYKASKLLKMNEKIINQGIYDNFYGYCYPVIKVSYIREYYKIFNSRLTLDKSIKYSRFRSKITIDDTNEYIMEVKSSNTEDINQIEQDFPFPKVRYSKYCNGVRKLGLI